MDACRQKLRAIDRFREVDVTYSGATPKLADAQHVIAREYGFANWAKLKAHVGSLSDNPMEALTAAVKGMTRSCFARCWGVIRCSSRNWMNRCLTTASTLLPSSRQFTSKIAT